MSQPIVAVYTIGQTPRPDLTEELANRFPSVHFQIFGALDGRDSVDVPAWAGRGYPLETRLRDGTRVVVEASGIAPLLQAAIDETEEMERRAAAHLLLCAGPFPRLAARAHAGSSRTPTPLIRPFDAGVKYLATRGLRRLEVVTPFADQAAPAMNKWKAADFACRAHVFEERPRHRSPTEWLTDLARRSRAQALVVDYVGFPPDILDDVAAAVDLPIVDLGRVALDVLEETLDTV